MGSQVSKLLSGIGLIFAALIFAPASHATVTLDVQNGILMGASGVDVGGSLYNVQFLDGTCNSLMDNCTSFVFTSQADATTASQALLDQVFIDGSAGNFDSNPDLTNGCTNVSGCDTYTAWGTSNGFVNTVGAQNGQPGSANDYTYDMSLGLTFDTTTNYADNWAVWTEVPEPASLSLLGIGLLGLGVNRKRQRKTRVD